MPTRWSKVETEKLALMRQNLAPLLAKRAQMPDVVGDRRLLRFLRGHGSNVDKACQMYAKFLEFRDANNVDDIRNDILFGHKNKIKTPFDFPNGRKILGLVPQIVISAVAQDKKRSPISTETFGFNPESILKAVTKEEYTIFMIYMLEYKILVLEQLAHERELGMKRHLESTHSDSTTPYGMILTCFVIRDFDGFSLGHMGNDGKTVMKWILEIAVNNYPETQHKCHMINIPWYFNTIWFFIKNLLDANILSKLTISSSSDYLDKLLEDITRENIPVSMGGSYTGYNEEFSFDLTESGPFYYPECEFMQQRKIQSSQAPMSGVTKKGVPVLKSMITDDYFEAEGVQKRKKKTEKRGSTTGSLTSDVSSVTAATTAPAASPPVVVAATGPPAFMPIASNHHLIMTHTSETQTSPPVKKKNKVFSKKKILRMFGIRVHGDTPPPPSAPVLNAVRRRSSSFSDLNAAEQVPSTPLSDSGLAVVASRKAPVEKQLSVNLKGEFAVIDSPAGQHAGPQRTHSLPTMDEFVPVTTPVVDTTVVTPAKGPEKAPSTKGRLGTFTPTGNTPRLKPYPGESIKDWQERNRRAASLSQKRLAVVPADNDTIDSTTTNDVESLLTRDTTDMRGPPVFQRNPHLQDGPVKQKTTTCIAEDTACVVMSEWWCF